MASGYLGKISAVVSANTADFQSKLNAAAKDVQKFASSMQGSLTSAQAGSSSALRGIYTDAQKLERALTAISTRKLSFRGFADKDINTAVGRMQALYSATEQINKPLAAAAKAFGKLPAEIQGAFLPALISSQKAAESLADEINRTGKVSEQRFDAVAAKIDRTTAAMSRLKEASSLVAGLSTGRELAFQRPEMVAETRRSASIQSDIGKLPPESIRGYAELVSQQRAAAVETERLASALEKAKLSRNGDVAAATAAYKAQIAAQRQLNDEIERRIQTEADASRRAAAAADAEIATLIRREQAAKAAEQARLAQAQSVADGEIATLIRVNQAAKAAEQERLALAQRVADGEIATLIRREQAAKAAEQARIAQAQSVADGEIATLIRREQAAKAAEQARLAQSQNVADGEIATLIRREQAAKAAEQERLAQSQKAADGEIANLIRVNQAAKAAEQERLALAERVADGEIATLIRRAQAEKAAELGGTTGLTLGMDIEAPARQLGVLQNSITSLKSVIDTLPEPLRVRFVPAIREAEAEFMRLNSAAVPIAGEIEAARQRLVRLTQDASRASAAMNFAQSFGGEGVTGIRLGLDQRALQGEVAALTALQGALGRTQAEARGPAVAAFNALRNAIAEAMAAGTRDEPATRQRIDRLRAAAVNATSQAGGGSVNRIRRDMQRAGDVGRGGFDNLSLAANQAAFAIDDFMSSTGGIDQKLRAVSNNVTQLAFVLGGTTGLFVGLGAVLAGQVAVGLVRFANNGRSAEDQTKALNDSLARQKSLVEELAQAFRSLGDAVSRSTLSAGGDSGRQFGQGVSDIRRKQRELREGRVAATDVGFQTNAANISRDRKQLETETDQGVRIGLSRRIQQAEAINRDLPRVLANRPPQLPAAPNIGVRSGTGEINGAGQLREVLFQEVLRNIPQTRRTTTGREAVPQEERERRAREMTAGVDDSYSSQRDVIEKLIGQLQPQADRGEYGFGETVRRLQSLLDQLESPFQKAIDDMALKVASASEEAARFIRESQEDVADAISRGVPGAARFQQELDSLASDLTEANAKLARSVEMAAETSDPAQREALAKDAEKQVAAVRIKQAETESRAREVRLGRSMGGERLTQATASLEGNERFRNERAGLIARGRAAADAELVARRNVERSAASVGDRQQQLRDARAELQKVMDAGGDTAAADAAVEKAEADLRAAEAASSAAGASLELSQKASEAAAALAEAAAGIEAALTRIRKIGDSALQRSEQGADAAQRAFEENPLRAGGREARDAAEERLINDRAAVGIAQADVDNRRRAIRQSPFMRPVNRELEEINQRRQELEAKDRIGGGLNQAESAELDAATKREIELIRQREMITTRLTEAERKQLDAINNGILAREKELEKGRQRAAEDPTFKRRMDATNQIIADSERQAAEAEQRYINNPNEKNRRERDEADARLRSDRQRAQELQDNLDNRRKEIDKDPAVAANNRSIAANDRRLADLAEKEAKGGLTGLEIAERDRIQEENRRMRGENEGAIDAGTRDERKAIDDERIAQNQRDRALRGRDLGLTDRERFRKEYTEGAGADINERAAQMRAAGEDPNKFLRQAFRNQMESVAPMLKGFQDERQTAMLQGPSRAALNVSDVSTSQGASELTRLIRGDDSAKDVNLAELKKQSGYLEDIRNDLKANNPGVLL